MGCALPDPESRSESSAGQIIEWVLAARRGDQSAYRELFDAYVGRVHQIAARLLTNREDVQELSQEVFTKAFGSLAQLQDPEKFGHWVFAITRRAAIDRLRKRARQKEGSAQHHTQSALQESEAVPSPLDQLLQQERIRLIRECIDQIPDENIRQTARYFYTFSGHETAEIAELMNVPLSTVTTRLERFRKIAARRLARTLLTRPSRDP